jgi:pheromone shutdown protein TraB
VCIEAIGDKSSCLGATCSQVFLRAALARVAASTAAADANDSSSSSSKGVVRPGVDFRAANECAEAIGAEIVLGDRPIEITLKRAWEALTLVEQGKLVIGLAMAVAGTSNASKQVSTDIYIQQQLFARVSVTCNSK